MNGDTAATWGPGARATLLAFERYFSWADTFRILFEERRGSYSDERKAHWEPYLAYWYGGLFIVVEGWRDLGLHDPDIDRLLNETEKLDILRRYRHGAFHFQREYLDPRFLDLWERPDVIVWVGGLHRELGRRVSQGPAETAGNYAIERSH